MFSLNAKAIAESGRDYYGNSWPFYFWHLGSFWATPVIVYLDAIFLKFLPFSEVTIRLGSIFVALLSTGLTMYLAQKLFKNKPLTLMAGFLMATTPALFINSRLLLDNIYPIPFVLIWLVFMYRYIETKKTFNLLISGLALGVGIHSYHAAKIMMPAYFLLTCFIFFPELKKDLKSLGLLILGFIIPILFFIPWLRAHPDTIQNQVKYISAVDNSFANRDFVTRILEFGGNFISYFDPRALFVEGDKTLIHSTGKIGVFLFPVVFPLVFGIFYLLKEKNRFSKLILFSLLLFPIAPSLVNDTQRISRALVVIPFGVIVSVYGLRFLLNQKD